MASVKSLNVGEARPTAFSDIKHTGIDKRPVNCAVHVTIPDVKGIGGSGITIDTICDKRHHGGSDQAIYAYAREDLDDWAAELGRELPSGMFGENLTTEGIDVTNARIGDRWLVGDEVLLEVSAPRIPCRTFAGWLGEQGWIRRFTDQAKPGTYLRVIRPGQIRGGDPITIVHRPEHDVTVQLTFRALTTAPELLPRLGAADALPEETKNRLARRTATTLDS